MTPKVLVTRVEPGASRTAARVRDLGFDPVLAPTARIESLEARLELRAQESLALTSPNGAVRAARLIETRDLPVFAVGDATAQAARVQGFTHVTSAGGDGAELAGLILKGGADPVVHVRGRDQAFDLVAALTAQGRRARSVIAYAAKPVRALPDSALAALDQGALVLIHSAKGAERFIALCPKPATRHPYVVISDAAAAPLRAAGIQTLIIAARPEENALLEAMRTALPRSA